MLIQGREDPPVDPSMLREPSRLLQRAPVVPPSVGAVLRGLWSCIALALVTSCSSFLDTDTQAPPDPPPDPSEMEVLVVPSEIAVPSGWSGTFTVQVLARDRDGNVFFQLPESGPDGNIVSKPIDVTWDTWDVTLSGVAADGQPGYLTQFKVSGFAQPEVRLAASVNGVPVKGTLTLRRSEVAGDEVQSELPAGDLVDVLLAAGLGEDGKCVDAAYGFVGHTAIPKPLAGEPCRNEATRFSQSRTAVGWNLAQWPEGANTTNAAGNAAYQWNVPDALPNEIKLTAYVLCQTSAPCPSTEQPDPELVKLMEDQVDYAITNFEHSRVGVSVSYTALEALDDPNDAKGCNSAARLLSVKGLFPKDDEVVALLIRGGGEIGFAGSTTAEMCGPIHNIPGLDARKGLIVMDPSTAWDAAVLAHELGHVLGLKEPDNGHVSLLHDIGHDNMMAASEKFIPRFRFTLGQVYRMNFAANGLLTANGRQPSVACGCDPREASPCPPLARDLKPLESPGSSWGGTCPSP